MRAYTFFRSILPAILLIACGTSAIVGLSACAGRKSGEIDFPDNDANIEAAKLLRVKGDRLFKDGKHLEACEHYKDAIKKHPSYGEAWNNLGLALMRDNNRYDAQQAFVRAGELMPLDPTPMDNIGVLYMETNLPEDALRFFEMALERRPQYLPSLRGAVRAAQLIGRSEEGDLARIKMGLRLESEPKWRTMFQRQLARVEADLEDQARNSPGFDRKKPGQMRSDAPQSAPAHEEAGVVSPRIDD